MADLPIEQQIVERLRTLDDRQKKQVLDFVSALKPVYTARELLNLPEDERTRYVAAAFEAASGEDFETFEAFGENDLDA